MWNSRRKCSVRAPGLIATESVSRFGGKHKFGVLLALMGGACTKTKLEGAIAHWTLPSAGSRDKRVTLAACAEDPLGQPFDHSRWTAVLQVR